MTWYTKTSNGTVNGPLSEEELHRLATSGELAGDTLVSKDKKDWQPAIQAAEVGLDCLVLSAEGGLNVLGPFAHENLSLSGQIGNIPRKGILFLRASSVESLPAVSGETGTSLVARVTQAESALRASERRLHQAEAEAKAKDLELEAERAKLRSEIVSLQAEVLKKDALLESTRKQAEADETLANEAVSLQARLVDLEQADGKNKRRIASLDSEKEALLAKQAELVAQTEKLTAELAVAREALATAQTSTEQKLADARGEVEAASQERDALRAELGETQRALEQTKQEASALETALLEARAATSAAEDKAARSRAETVLAKEACRVLCRDLQAVLKRAEPQFEESGEAGEPAQVSAVDEHGEALAVESAEIMPAMPAKDVPPQAAADAKAADMIALESQLQKELSMAARLKAGGASAGGRSSKRGNGRGGFVRIFGG